MPLDLVKEGDQDVADLLRGGFLTILLKYLFVIYHNILSYYVNISYDTL